jgi:hypothetical protein
MNSMRKRLANWLIVLPVLAAGACKGGAGSKDSTPYEGKASAATRAQTASAIKTAERPASVCDWLPIADVEAILGPLAGAPVARPETCRYRLPMDSATARLRAADDDWVSATAPARRRAKNDSISVIVAVELDSDLLDERAAKIATNTAGGWVAAALGKNAPGADTTKRRNEPMPPAGWDDADVPDGNEDFRGRTGNLVVQVEENADRPAVAAEKKARLAALMRDRIPDLPFRPRRIDDGEPVTRTPPSGPDPCSLLTRNEAERVLGKLVVPPYRSQGGGPLYDEWGRSCAYFTAGHRTFVVTPHWTEGKEDLKYQRFGGAIAALTRDREGEAVDTLDGPWDDVALGLSGELLFLKGDRLLEIAAGTSSVGQAKALELVHIAFKRFTAYQLPTP